MPPKVLPPLHTHSGICFACGGASVCPKQPPWPGRNAPEQLPCRPVYAFPVLIHPSIPSTFTPSVLHSLLLLFCFLLLVLSHQAVFLLTLILVIFCYPSASPSAYSSLLFSITFFIFFLLLLVLIIIIRRRLIMLPVLVSSSVFLHRLLVLLLPSSVLRLSSFLFFVTDCPYSVAVCLRRQEASIILTLSLGFL